LKSGTPLKELAGCHLVNKLLYTLGSRRHRHRLRQIAQFW